MLLTLSLRKYDIEIKPRKRISSFIILIVFNLFQHISFESKKMIMSAFRILNTSVFIRLNLLKNIFAV